MGAARWPGTDVLAAGLLLGGPASVRANDPNAITDPFYPFQWPLDNIGQDYPFGCDPNSTCESGTPGADLHWAESYAAGVTGDGVILALAAPCLNCTAPLTYGPTVKCLNPDIVSRLWVNPGDVMGWQNPPTVAIYDTETNSAEIVTL